MLATGNVFGQVTVEPPDSAGQSIPVFKPIQLEPPRYWLVLKRDVAAVTTAPLQWDSKSWMKFGAGVGVVALLMVADDEIQRQVASSSNGTTARVAGLVEPFGSEYSWAVLAGFYGMGRLFGNERAVAVAEDGLASSLIASGLVTGSLKILSGRTRPSKTSDPFQFLQEGSSFPSGHTTQAFALAAVIAEHYDSLWIDSLAYGLAGLVGCARVVHGAHFASDVVAGAAIGVAVGKAVVRLNAEQRTVSLRPMVTRDGVGFSVGINLANLRRNAPRD